MSFAALLWLAACGGGQKGRVVVVALDGLEYSELDRGIERGDLPHFKRLMAEGVRAEMEVTTPIMSPILWTTIASGYPATDHGIGGWTDGATRSYSAADVRVKRVWDVLGEARRPVVVSGWLMTWPAAPVHGALLSERFVWSFPMNKRSDDETLATDIKVRSATAFPESLIGRATTLRPDEAWLAQSPLAYQVESYGAPFHPLLRDETHLRVFEALWPEAGADFGAVYLNGADQVSHIYWPFTDPTTYAAIAADPATHHAAAQAQALAHPERRPPPYADGITPERLAQAARFVPDYYRYLDGALARVMALVGPDTTLIVCSDHGFRTSTAQPLTNGSHNPTAVFLAWGARVKPGRAAAPIHVFDVAPTLYRLLDLPNAADTPGSALESLFVLPDARAPVPTRKLERAMVGAAEGGLADEQLKEQLEALGYLDDDVPVGASRRP